MGSWGASSSGPCSSSILATTCDSFTEYWTSTSRLPKNEPSQANGRVSSESPRPASRAASAVASVSTREADLARGRLVAPVAAGDDDGRAASSALTSSITSGSEASPRPPTSRPATWTLRMTWPDSAAVSMAQAPISSTRARTGPRPAAGATDRSAAGPAAAKWRPRPRPRPRRRRRRLRGRGRTGDPGMRARRAPLGGGRAAEHEGAVCAVAAPARARVGQVEDPRGSAAAPP